VSKFDKLQAFAGNINSSIGVGAPARGPSVAPASIPAKDVGVCRSRDAMEIDVDRIVPDPDQPRKEFDEDALSRLAESLKARGQIQPIQVRWDEGVERYVVLVGERRWRAARAAGLPKLRCIVRSAPLSEDERLSVQLVENCLREDLTPMDQARAFRALMDRQGWTVRKLADELAISPGRVSQAVALLSLPAPVQEQVDRGGISSTTAYEIAKLDDPADQVRLATAAAEQGLTRADVAKQARSRPAKKRAAAAKKHPPARVWRIDGCRIEVSRKAGVDASTALDVLRRAAAMLEAEICDSTADAA
jgi:ParB family chromosome partitioning protein